MESVSIQQCPNMEGRKYFLFTKHIFSDEVFVLLYGECILLLSGEEEPGNIYGVKLEKGKVYNVPKGMWHSHVLGDNTKILVVENQDTVPENSPKIPFPCSWN